jgi:hypothetical protein
MIKLERSLAGGCQCGAVRYRVEPAEVDSAYCHCRTCQRISGAPVVAWFSVPVARFSYTRGVPRSYRSSAQATREFCGVCGTPLLFRPDHGRSADVNTSTLDEPSAVPPGYHIWRMSRIAWFETSDALPRFDDGGPDTY